MKAEKSKDKFEPVIITLETEREFDFLFGLMNQSKDDPKKNADDFDEDLDQTLFDLLKKHRQE